MTWRKLAAKEMTRKNYQPQERPETAPLRALRNLTLCSADFQTCRIADPPEMAGREAAPEVGLEICAAASDIER